MTSPSQSQQLQLKVFITFTIAITTSTIPQPANGLLGGSSGGGLTDLIGTIFPTICDLVPQLPVEIIPGDCYILNPIIPLDCITTVPLNHTMAQINANTISTSGFSSGGYMAPQLHYSFSSHIKKVGMFAGGAYSVFYNRTGFGAYSCFINLATDIAGFANRNISELENNARAFEAQGKIDPLSNIGGSRVYIYTGGLDTFVHSWYGEDARKMYQDFGANVKYVNQASATHCVPTLCEGDLCPVFSVLGDAVNRCGYAGIDEMFQYLLGPDGYISANCNDMSPPKGKYYSFDQAEFIPDGVPPSKYFMAPNGYIYVPKQCQDPAKTCHLHIALHGCFQNIYSQISSNRYARKTCYTQAADKNNIIVVFPQADTYHVDITSNIACWDFCSGANLDYPNKLAPQIQVLAKMIESIAGITL